MSAFSNETREPLVAGFIASLVVHSVLVYFLFFFLKPTLRDFAAPVVYSVTLEGGRTLGGRSQAPESNKSALAPPKSVSTPDTPTLKTPDLKRVTPDNPSEKAEVSLAEKKDKVVPVIKPPPPKPTPELKPKKVEKERKAPPPVDANKEYQKAMQRYLGESADTGAKGFGAAVVGGRGMGGGSLVSPEALAYQNLLSSHVQSVWTWPDASSHFVGKVYFKIDRDGTVHDIKLIQKSGNEEFDRSVLRAILKANPVPPPPEKIYDGYREVQMTMDPRDKYLAR